MIDLIEVFDRAETGPLTSETDYYMKRYVPKLTELIARYKIKWDKETIINADDDRGVDLARGARLRCGGEATPAAALVGRGAATRGDCGGGMGNQLRRRRPGRGRTVPHPGRRRRCRLPDDCALRVGRLRASYRVHGMGP